MSASTTTVAAASSSSEPDPGALPTPPPSSFPGPARRCGEAALGDESTLSSRVLRVRAMGATLGVRRRRPRPGASAAGDPAVSVSAAPPAAAAGAAWCHLGPVERFELVRTCRRLHTVHGEALRDAELEWVVNSHEVGELLLQAARPGEAATMYAAVLALVPGDALSHVKLAASHLATKPDASSVAEVPTSIDHVPPPTVSCACARARARTHARTHARTGTARTHESCFPLCGNRKKKHHEFL